MAFDWLLACISKMAAWPGDNVEEGRLNSGERNRGGPGDVPSRISSVMFGFGPGSSLASVIVSIVTWLRKILLLYDSPIEIEIKSEKEDNKSMLMSGLIIVAYKINLKLRC